MKIQLPEKEENALINSCKVDEQNINYKEFNSKMEIS